MAIFSCFGLDEIHAAAAPELLASIEKFHTLGNSEKSAEGALRPLVEQASAIKEAFYAIRYEALSAAEILLPDTNKGAHVSALAARNSTANFLSR